MSESAVVAFDEREYTLAELDGLANGMATTLEQRGVRAGDRVALMSSNRPEFVIALRAIWRLGAAAVLLSPAWRDTEVEHGSALVVGFVDLVDEREVEHVVPPLRGDVAIGDRQVDMG